MRVLACATNYKIKPKTDQQIRMASGEKCFKSQPWVNVLRRYNACVIATRHDSNPTQVIASIRLLTRRSLNIDRTMCLRIMPYSTRKIRHNIRPRAVVYLAFIKFNF